jgi:hypothetical protein
LFLEYSSNRKIKPTITTVGIYSIVFGYNYLVKSHDLNIELLTVSTSLDETGDDCYEKIV